MKGTKDYIFLSLLALTICQSSYSQIYDQYISVSTDKYEYELGEPIQIVVSAFNPTASPITLSWPTACQATYWIDAYRVSPSVCATVITEITIPPYSSHSWEFTHSSGIYPVDIGPHSIRGEVIDYGISDPVTINVSSPCVPYFSASPTIGCAPLTVQFTDQSTGDITSWHWSFGDAATSIVQNPSYTFTTPGQYTVCLTVYGPCGSSTVCKTIIVLPPITSDFNAGPTSGCAPLEVQFTDQSSGDITSWNWSFGDGASSTLRQPLHAYHDTGHFDVSLIISGPCGSDTVSKPGYIVLTDSVVAAFGASPISGQSPLTVQFDDQSSGMIVSCLWDFGDDDTSTQHHSSHTYTSPGSYTVSLTVLGACNTDTCIKQNLIQVEEVNAIGETPLIPDAFALGPAYPNPFNPETTIGFDVAVATHLTISLYDLWGREIVMLADGYWRPGRYRTVWRGTTANGVECPSGIYIARLIAPGFAGSIKIVLLR